MTKHNRREQMDLKLLTDNTVVVVGVLIAVFGFIAYLVFGPEVGSDLINQVGGGESTITP